MHTCTHTTEEKKTEMKLQLGVLADAYNFSTWEAEVRGLKVLVFEHRGGEWIFCCDVGALTVGEEEMRKEERRPTQRVRIGKWASHSASEAGPGHSTQALLWCFKAELQGRTLDLFGVFLHIHEYVGHTEIWNQ